MRQLQVVGVSTDGRLLLLAPSADGRATHAVELDRRLERAVRGQPLDDSGVQGESLSPKDIQARLRSGASIEQVARDAGVPIGRVERYAGPVLSEREQVLAAARASTMARPRGNRSMLPLGEAIEANLRSLAYARPETGEWSAYRADAGGWIVRYDVTIRGRRRRAEWAHHPATREVTALNGQAASLGLIEPGRGRETPAERSDTPPARRPAAAKVPVTKQAPVKATGRKTAGKKAIGKKATTTSVARTPVAATPRKRPAKAAPQARGAKRTGRAS